MKTTYNLKSGFVYILSDPDKYIQNKIKIGFTSNNKEYLINRYITSIPQVKIHLFIGMDDNINPTISIPFAGELERNIINNYDDYRIIGAKGNKSEWLENINIEDIKTYIINARNNMLKSIFCYIINIDNLYLTNKNNYEILLTVSKIDVKHIFNCVTFLLHKEYGNKTISLLKIKSRLTNFINILLDKKISDKLVCLTDKNFANYVKISKVSENWKQINNEEYCIMNINNLNLDPFSDTFFDKYCELINEIQVKNNKPHLQNNNLQVTDIQVNNLVNYKLESNNIKIINQEINFQNNVIRSLNISAKYFTFKKFLPQCLNIVSDSFDIISGSNKFYIKECEIKKLFIDTYHNPELLSYLSNLHTLYMYRTNSYENLSILTVNSDRFNKAKIFDSLLKLFSFSDSLSVIRDISCLASSTLLPELRKIWGISHSSISNQTISKSLAIIFKSFTGYTFVSEINEIRKSKNYKKTIYTLQSKYSYLDIYLKC